MFTPEEGEREFRDPLASERRKEQISHLEHRAASAETAEVSQFLQELLERIASPIVLWGGCSARSSYRGIRT